MGVKEVENSMTFEVKDSGTRQQFESGMVRDTVGDKIDWGLIVDGPMMKRWAEHLTKGAVKYSSRNWMKAEGEPELDRFRASAFRHFMQWYLGETDEDHAAAVFFNINGTEYVKEKMESAIHPVFRMKDIPKGEDFLEVAEAERKAKRYFDRSTLARED